MGIYDRDYWKDRKPGASSSSPRPGDTSPFPRKPSQRSRSRWNGDWHWSLIALFWVFLIFILSATFHFFR